MTSRDRQGIRFFPVDRSSVILVFFSERKCDWVCVLIDNTDIEENFFAVSRYWGSLTSFFSPDASIGAMSTGVAVSDINWAWNQTPLTVPGRKFVGDAIHYYDQADVRFWWWVFPGAQSSETHRLLLEAGLRFYAKVPCMTADLQTMPGDESMHDAITFLQVKTKTDLQTWTDVSFAGFEMPIHVRDQYNRFISSFIISDKSPQKLFIAFLDNKPAATSLLFTYRHTAGLYYVSTLPKFRNKGCGLKVTRAAMICAKESGLKNVVLQATPLGEKIYRKTGFRISCLAEIYKKRVLL